jgi:penicillin-binding protein 1C
LVSLPSNKIQITGISDSTQLQYHQDDIPRVYINSVGGVGDRDWYINGQYIATLADKQPLPASFDRSGSHQIMVVDQQGNSDLLELQVVLAKP